MRTKNVTLLLMICAFCVGVTEEEDQERCDPNHQDFKSHEPTEAEVGNNVTLSCVPHTFSINNLVDVVIDWKKDGVPIYLIKENRVNYIKKEFKGRIVDSISEMGKKGHASISLTNLTKTDGGEYCCCIEQISTKDVKCINHTLVITDVPTTKPPSKVRHDVPTTNTPLNGTTEDLTPLWISLGVVIVALVIVIFVLCCKEKKKKRDTGMEMHSAASSKEEEKPNDLNRRDIGSKSEREGLISRGHPTTQKDD